MITVLCGGVGAARFLAGLVQVVAPADITAHRQHRRRHRAARPGHLAPTSTPSPTRWPAPSTPSGAGASRGETWRAMERPGALRGGAPDGLVGRRRRGSTSATATWPPTSTAPHRLAEGAPLSTVTAEIAPAWGLGVRLLPMTDDAVRDDGRPSPARARSASRSTSSAATTTCADHRRCASPASSAARPGPGVLEALDGGRGDRDRAVEPDRVDRAAAGRGRRARAARSPGAPTWWRCRRSSAARAAEGPRRPHARRARARRVSAVGVARLVPRRGRHARDRHGGRRRWPPRWRTRACAASSPTRS